MKDLATRKGRVFSYIGRKILLLAAGIGLVAGFSALAPSPALACVSCTCLTANHTATQEIIRLEHGQGTFQTDPESMALSTNSVCQREPGTRGWIAYEFCRHREEFIVFYWFKEHILAALMMMTEQLVSSAMNQMFIIGAFFDAEQQLETQRTFQELAAKAHKDYHPSMSMCEIGTIARSLGSTQRQGEFNAYALSQFMQDRQMRNLSTPGSGGQGQDIVARWAQFRDTFCNPDDNNAELGSDPVICRGTTLTSELSPRNTDVDYVRSVGHPNTIFVDFTDTFENFTEESIFALSHNLYGHQVFEYFPEAYFRDGRNHDDFMHLRSIVAKRSVAQNSFNNIVALKAQGREPAEETREYMERVLEQLGLTDADQRQKIVAGVIIGSEEPGFRPSYYSLMEFLTKKLYQRPEFYTNLYDKPANIERAKAAMKALDLSQSMDLYKSKLRSEAALAVLTDLEIAKEQELVQDRMLGVEGTGVQ